MNDSTKLKYKIRNRNYSFSETQFRDAVKDNFSKASVMKSLNLVVGGANYKKVQRLIHELNLTTDHWTGQGHLKGKSHGWAKKCELSDILVEHSTYTNTNKLKQRLIKEGILVAKCWECDLTSWRENPISLHMDHRNGVDDDNRIENLRLLCPNCHSQTETYCGRNKGNGRGSRTRTGKPNGEAF